MQGIISLPTGSVEGMEQSVQHHVMVRPDLATVIREREMHMLPMEAVDYIVQYFRTVDTTQYHSGLIKAGFRREVFPARFNTCN